MSTNKLTFADAISFDYEDMKIFDSNERYTILISADSTFLLRAEIHNIKKSAIKHTAEFINSNELRMHELSASLITNNINYCSIVYELDKRLHERFMFEIPHENYFLPEALLEVEFLPAESDTEIYKNQRDLLLESISLV